MVIKRKDDGGYKEGLVNADDLDASVLISQTVETFIAGEVLGGQKAVYLNDGKLYLASNSNLNCIGKVIGFSTHAATLNADCAVKKSGVLNSFNALTPNAIYFLGLNGEITSTRPTTGFSQIIGYAKSATELVINIQIPIKVI